MRDVEAYNNTKPPLRHTLLPLDDCLYALQPTIPHLTRSSLHRCLQSLLAGRVARQAIRAARLKRES